MTRNLKIVVACGSIVVGMLVLVAWSLPLYRAFCEATGLGGTTRRATEAPAMAADRMIEVRFNTDVSPGLPWRFAPAQDHVTVALGKPTLVTFWAENLSDEPIVGHATYNVTPELAGRYFNKIQCFCFDEERLAPHQRVEMPVTFFVDPALASDPDMGAIDTLTLSYTFFRSRQPEKARDLSRLGESSEAAAVVLTGDPQRGRSLFQVRCTACHALDHNKVGPSLAGLAHRPAGAEPGFSYSAALAGSNIVWEHDTLDRWLAGPREAVPGARMAFRIEEPQDRADIIAYLLNNPS